jgi:restriction endonuclease S subunit
MTNYPIHWKTRRLEDVSDVIDPHPSHRAPPIDPNGIPFVGIGDVREDGVADFRKARLVSPKILSEHATRYSLESDLIGLGRVASVGKVVKLPKGDIPYTISPTLAVILPVDISFDFLYYALQSPQIQNQLTGLKQGSGRQSVGILKLRKVLLPCPPVEEQLKIVELLEDHLSRLDAALTDLKQAKIRSAQFRRSLFYSLFNGLVGEFGKKVDWKSYFLSEIVEILDNRRIPVNSTERSFRSGTVPYYGATGQVGTIDKPIFDDELLLLGEDGVQFFDPDKPKAYLIAGPSWVNNHAHVLKGKDSIVNQKLLMHYLNQFNYVGYANGTTRLKLTQGSMNRIPVSLPSRPIQEEMIEFIDQQLSIMDASVKAAESVTIQSLTLRRSLLQAAFTGQLTKEIVSV